MRLYRHRQDTGLKMTVRARYYRHYKTYGFDSVARCFLELVTSHIRCSNKIDTWSRTGEPLLIPAQLAYRIMYLTYGRLE
jgi:hypothetical protein